MATIQAETGKYALTIGGTTLHLLTRLPEDHPFYAMVGRVASEWSHLEHMLDLIIWELMQIAPEFGSSVTGQMIGHGPRFRAILALGHKRKLNAQLIARAKKLMERTFEAAEQRNRIIHDAWYLHDGTKTPAQFKSSSHRGGKHGFQLIGDDEIAETLRLIKDRFTEISTLRSDIQGAIQT